MNQAKAASHTNALRIEAAPAEGLAESQTEVDVATFIQWVDATAGDDREVAAFDMERCRAEFQPAFEAWLATEPLTNPDAPPTPSAMDEYQVEAATEAERLDVESERSAAQDLRNIQRASNYVHGVVLFAVSLFFAGMSGKLRGSGARKATLAIGCVVFVTAVVWIATFPVSLAV